MSRLFNASEIAAEALRKIGAYAINDSAPDPREHGLALNWLDLVMAELSGTQKCWWLVPQSIDLDLTSGTRTYLLTNILGSLAPDGMVFPVRAALLRNGTETDLRLVTRQEYDAIAAKATAGTPELLHVDRLREATMNVYPVPAEAGLQVRLTFQKFAPTVAAGGNNHGLRLSWQRWAIYRVASDIGDGTVRHVPVNELKALEAKAREGKAALDAYDNREHQSYPRRVKPYGVM